MVSEEETAKNYIRQYLAIIWKSLLACCSILLAADLFLSAFAPLLALAMGMYLFLAVYFTILIKPVVIQDALFWITYGVLMGVTTVALNRICVTVPAISTTSQPRILEGQYFIGCAFPAVVTVIFWIVVRSIRFVKDHWRKVE
jgi:hypothetical protein